MALAYRLAASRSLRSTVRSFISYFVIPYARDTTFGYRLVTRAAGFDVNNGKRLLLFFWSRSSISATSSVAEYLRGTSNVRQHDFEVMSMARQFIPTCWSADNFHRPITRPLERTNRIVYAYLGTLLTWYYNKKMPGLRCCVRSLINAFYMSNQLCNIFI